MINKQPVLQGTYQETIMSQCNQPGYFIRNIGLIWRHGLPFVIGKLEKAFLLILGNELITGHLHYLPAILCGEGLDSFILVFKNAVPGPEKYSLVIELDLPDISKAAVLFRDQAF